MALAAQALAAQKARKPLEQGRALEQVAARIKRVMGLTDQAKRRRSRPLERRVRHKRQNGKPQLDDVRNPRKSTKPRRRRDAAKKTATSASYTSARGQKGLKLAKT